MKKPLRRIIKINLLKKQDSPDARLIFIGVLAIVLLIISGILSGVYYMEKKALAEQQKINVELMAQANKNKIAQESLASQKKLAEILNLKKSNIEKLEKAQQSFTEVLNEINLALPGSVVLTAIDITNTTIKISGFSPDQEQVAVLLSGLRKSKYFEHARAVDSSFDEKTGECSFSIEMSWEEEKP